MSLTEQQIKDIVIRYVTRCEKAKLALLFEVSSGVKEGLTSYIKKGFFPPHHAIISLTNPLVS